MKKSLYAFSLIELLLVLLLLSLFFLHIPYLSTLWLKQKVKLELEALAHACEFSRQIALISGQETVICHSRSKKYCDGTWNNGFIVIQGNKLLESHTTKPLPGKLLWKGFLSKDYLQFSSHRFDLAMAGRFEFQPEPGKEGLKMSLVVNNAGRLKVLSSN